MSGNEKKQATCWMTGTKFEVGDIVTRGGNDRQKILDTNGYGMIEVECIKEPLGWLNDDGSRGEPWCKLGDREWNLTRRYSFPGVAVRPRFQNNDAYYRAAMEAMSAGFVLAVAEGRVSYGVQPSAMSDDMRASLQSLSDYIQAEVDAENARDQARWAEIASLCQPNGGDA